jgi:hypothetical protein
MAKVGGPLVKGLVISYKLFLFANGPRALSVKAPHKVSFIIRKHR